MKKVTLLLLWALILIQPLTAAPENRDRIQDFKMWKLVSALDLNQDQSSRFVPIYNDLDKLTRTYIENKQNNMKKIDQLIESRSSDNGAMERLLNDIEKDETYFLRNKRDLENNLFKVLNVMQRAAYVKFEFEFPKMLREMMRDQGDRGPESSLRDDRPGDRSDTLRQRTPYRERW